MSTELETAHQEVTVNPGDKLTLPVMGNTEFILQFGEKTSDEMRYVELVFNTSDVTAKIIARYKLEPKEQLNLVTVARHTVPRTTCHTDIKGVLYDNTSSGYVGKIIIEKQAQQTASYLEHAVLIAGQNTKNNSQPILQIDANDVKASHGATTGRVNQDHVYYLTTRGLTKTEAEAVIIEGFLSY